MEKFTIMINRGARTNGLPRTLSNISFDTAMVLAQKYDLVPMILTDNGYSHSSSDPTTFPKLEYAMSMGWYKTKTIHLFTRAWAKPSSEYSGS